MLRARQTFGLSLFLGALRGQEGRDQRPRPPGLLWAGCCSTHLLPCPGCSGSCLSPAWSPASGPSVAPTCTPGQSSKDGALAFPGCAAPLPGGISQGSIRSSWVTVPHHFAAWEDCSGGTQWNRTQASCCTRYGQALTRLHLLSLALPCSGSGFRANCSNQSAHTRHQQTPRSSRPSLPGLGLWDFFYSLSSLGPTLRTRFLLVSSSQEFSRIHFSLGLRPSHQL